MATLRTTFLAALSVVAVSAAGCGANTSDASADSNSVRVDVVNIAFAPATIEIEAGTEVVWANKDEGVHHTATSGLPGDGGVPGVSEPEPPRPDGVFDGDLADASAEFTFTFTEAGTYEYFCRVHPSMTGGVIVN